MSLYRLSQHGEDDLVFVRSLTIERFRGLEHLEWQPPGRVNCLIGPGDAGKSTILSAIEMVLDPRPSPTTSEYDYFRRRVEEDFRITAVLGDLDDQAVSAMRTPPLQGWLDGRLWRTVFRVAAGELKERGRRTSEHMEGVYEMDDLARDLVTALAELSEKQRAAVVLHHAAGYPAKEIAEIIGSTTPGVHVLLSRARKRLRELLEVDDA